MDGSSAAPAVETERPRPPRGLALLRLAHREMLDWSLVQASFCTTAGLVLVAAVVVPIGIVAQLGLPERLAYWSVCGLLCWPPGHAVTAAILYLMRSRPPMPIALAAVAGVLFLSLPFTAVGYGVYGWLSPEGAAPMPVGRFFANVAVLALGVSALVHYVACQRARTRFVIAAGGGADGGDGDGGVAPVRAPGEAAPVPRLAGSAQAFFDRLPRHVGRDVIYANVSGHYLQVVTTAGTCLVLMRLSDAVLALGDAGMQVHRSYWVAHRHIDGVIQRGQRTLLRLTGAHEIPVSRTHLASVRAAVAVEAP